MNEDEYIHSIFEALIDCYELPPDVSREMLQKILQILRKNREESKGRLDLTNENSHNRTE